MKQPLLPVLCFLLLACTNKKQTDKEKLIGTWRPVALSASGMDEEEKKDILEKASIEFTTEGRYFSRFEGDDENGTWTYDEKTKKLSTNPSESGNNEHFTVEWKADTLVLMNDRNDVIKMKKKKIQ